MKYFLATLLCLSSIACFAAIYLQKDKDGNTIYSDTPLTNNLKQVNIPATDRVPAQQLPPQQNTPPTLPEKITNKPYTTFLITSPRDQETIQNQPVISVSVKLEPELQQGDKIQLYLDGKAFGEATESTQFTLDHIDRGIHQIYTAIVDSSQKIVKKSAGITIFVHYASVNG